MRRARQHRQHPARECRFSSRSPAAPRRRQQQQQLRLMPNEYEAFFNKASKMGADATRNLAPEERARRAMEASSNSRGTHAQPARASAVVPYMQTLARRDTALAMKPSFCWLLSADGSSF